VRASFGGGEPPPEMKKERDDPRTVRGGLCLNGEEGLGEKVRCKKAPPALKKKQSHHVGGEEVDSPTTNTQTKNQHEQAENTKPKK